MARARCAPKIDMQAPNVWLRDPVLYRIRHAAHHQTGDKWCIYPTLRFRAWPERLPRRHHALALHAGIRSPPAALRLDSGSARPPAAAAASIRIRPPQSHLHRDEQAQAQAAGRRGPRQRLGRSAPADHLRDAAARRDRERAARFCLPHRDHEISVSHRGGRPRVCDAR